MDATDREPCFACAEPVALEAQICPHCRRSVLVEVGLERSIADGRLRYRLARALAGLGPPLPTFLALQTALAAPRPIIARGVTRGVARRVADLLAQEGLRVALVAAGGSQGQPDQGRADRPGQGRAWSFATLASPVAVLIVLTVGIWWGWRLVGGSRQGEAPAPSPAPASAPAARLTSARSFTTREIADRFMSSTVSLRCTNSVGSGFFVGPDTILTNAHVLCSDGAAIQVVFSDGRKLMGWTRRADTDLDLATVSVSGSRAMPLPLGDVGDAGVGDKVVFIGSPVGLEFTVHEGSISSLQRSLFGLALVQLDAKVNPGNSGGPVIDAQGRVIGIVTLKHAAAEGIGLAVPINYAYSGAQPLLVPPNGLGSSPRFDQMAVRAKSESGGEERREASGSSPRLPILLAVSIDQYDRLVAHVVLPAPTTPGYRDVALKVWDSGEAICTLKGDISKWERFDEKAPLTRFDPKLRPLLQKRSLNGTLFIGEAPVQAAFCFRGRQVRTVVVELEGADPQGSRLRLN
jgi:serine protease Do